MGLWFVIACKPTYFETKACNAIERYYLVDPCKEVAIGSEIKIDFRFKNSEEVDAKEEIIPQKGWVDSSTGSTWKVSPFWPVKMPYLILEVDETNYDYCVIGYPSRAYCWIMSRKPTMEKDVYDNLIDKLKTKHLYELEGLRVIPQKWSEEELRKMGAEGK